MHTSLDCAAIDAPGGFLFEWWSIFWDIFDARTRDKPPQGATPSIDVISLCPTHTFPMFYFNHATPSCSRPRVMRNTLCLCNGLRFAHEYALLSYDLETFLTTLFILF